MLTNNATKIDPLIGVLFNNTYRIDALMAQGGMGAIYRATQLPLGHTVAVKILLPELRRDERLVKRFFRETKILGELCHPNIVQLVDCGSTPDGLLFLVMEHLRGQSLDQMVPKGEGIPLPRALHIVRQICEGMASAHQNNLVHRDLKPSNIFIVEGACDEVRVLDFGIAKPLGDVDIKLTQTGLIMGTPGFIAPEQITGSTPPDQRADIYSLGANLYYLLAGKAPYVGTTPQSIITQQLTQPPDTRVLNVPSAIERVISKAMQIEPARRYQTVQELSGALALL